MVLKLEKYKSYLMGTYLPAISGRVKNGRCFACLVPIIFIYMLFCINGFISRLAYVKTGKYFAVDDSLNFPLTYVPLF